MSDGSEQAQRPFSWRVATLAGLIAGLVFLVVITSLMPLVGGTVWTAPRMMAGIAMGPDVLPPPATFDLGIVVVGMIVHFVLSMLFAAVAGLLVRGQTVFVAVLIGTGFGLLLYLFNYFVFTGFFPWFAEIRNWVSVLAHLAFGGAAALSYAWLSGEIPAGRAATTPA